MSDVLVETNKLILKGYIKRIFTDERRGEGNALRAATFLVKDGHFTKEDFGLLADIMEHWYMKTDVPFVPCSGCSPVLSTVCERNICFEIFKRLG